MLKSLLAGLIALAVTQGARPFDPATVTSKTQAKAAAATGALVATHVFPVEVGGPEEELNVTYLPPSAMPRREAAIATIMRDVEAGRITRMTVDADYRGDSVVPSRIIFHPVSANGRPAPDVAFDVW